MPKPTRPRLFPFTFGASSKGWHEIQPFTICPKDYQYGVVRKIRQVAPSIPEGLSYGLFMHAARAQWLHDGYKGDVWREALVEYGRQAEEHNKLPMAAGMLAAATKDFEEYTKYWLKRPRPEVLAIEYELKARGLKPDAPAWAHRTARLDSIERWQGKVYIGEFKSTSRTDKHVAELYAVNGQTLLQVALWSDEETKRFGPLAGILLDVVSKGTKSRPARGNPRIIIRKEQLSHALTWFHREFKQWVMNASTIEWNSTVPRSMVCMRPHGPCRWRPLCARGRDGAGQFQLGDGTQMHKWKPSPGKEVPPWD